MTIKTLIRYIWGFIIGVLMAILLNDLQQDKRLQTSRLRYDSEVMCLVLARRRKNGIAAAATWAKQCEAHSVVRLKRPERRRLRTEESSWRVLCDALRVIDVHDWTLVVYDDTFALPENLKRKVMYLNPDGKYYLGHAVKWWGLEYNTAGAGYALSRGSVLALRNLFNSTEACATGGRFWKQEDLYLGQHLYKLGVRPSDTRDKNGLSTFHGNGLAHLLTGGHDRSRPTVWEPRGCCSPWTITFQTVEAERLHTHYYLLYRLRIGAGAAGKPPKAISDDEVWRAFVRERGISDSEEVSNKKYYEMWKEIVNDPINFNRNIRNWSALAVEDDIED